MSDVLSGLQRCQFMLKSRVAFFACRTTEHVLKLEDPNSLEDDMGVIVLNLNLIVKQGDFKRHVSVNLSG